MRCPLKPLAALLACAVALSGIGSPLTPASPFAASVASAAGPASATTNATATKANASPSATAKKSSPTLAPRRPTADPISQAKAVLVAPATFAAGAITAIDSTGSVGDAFEWRISPSDRPFLVGDGRKQAWSFRNAGEAGAADPFAVTLLVFTKAKDGTVTSVDVATAIVKPAGPAPKPVVVPVDPTPVDPDPSPVDPPTHDDALPTSQPGLRVLIVEETDAEARAALSAGQRAIIQGTAANSFRAFLKGNADLVVADPQADFSRLPVVWSELFKRPRKSVPWFVVTNGKTGYEGPLPGDPVEAIAIVKRVGGIK